MNDALNAIIQLNGDNYGTTSDITSLAQKQLDDREVYLYRPSGNNVYMYVGTGVNSANNSLTHQPVSARYADNAGSANALSTTQVGITGNGISLYWKKGSNSTDGRTVAINRSGIEGFVSTISSGGDPAPSTFPMLKGFNIDLTNAQLTRGIISNTTLQQISTLTLTRGNAWGTSISEAPTNAAIGQLFFVVQQ